MVYKQLEMYTILNVRIMNRNLVNKTFFLCALLVLCCFEIISQSVENEVPKIEVKYQIMAKAYEDSIVLRFAQCLPMRYLHT